jgi:hypothetical protein
MKLTQGNKSLNEYLQAFNNLVRYAPKFVDTNAKKIASFNWGLSPKLMKCMGNSKYITFKEFISDALTQEDNDKIYATSKTRKRNFEAGASQSKASVVSKTQYHPPATNVWYRPPQKKNQAKTGFRKGYTRIILDKTVPTFCHLTGQAGIATSRVTGLIVVLILPSRTLRETSVRGVFTILVLRKFLLVKWSLLVSFLLMIILQLCSLIQVLHIPL